MIETFDSDNLRQAKDGQGNVVVYSEGMLSESPEYETVKLDLETKQILLTTRDRCRRLLSGEDSLSEEEVEGFWNQIQSVLSRNIPDDFDPTFFGPEHCIAGGAAVLLACHRGWLRRYPEREQWCVDELVGMVLNPPAPSFMDNELTPVDTRWQGFCADALPVLWAEDPESPEFRQCMARLATDEKYDTIRILLESAARFRQQLGSDFYRLQHLVMRWAAARRVYKLVQRSGSSEPNVSVWLDNEIEQFCQGGMLAEVPEWTNIRRSVNEELPYSSPFDCMEEARDLPGIDLRLVMAAYAWLPSFDETLNSEDRAEWIRFLEESLGYSMDIITGILAAGGKSDTTNHEWYDWLFRRLVRVIPVLSEEEKPERFWMPMLGLGVAGHRWTESFLAWWFIENLQSTPISEGFLAAWRRMIDFVFQSPHWSFKEIQCGHHHLEEMWCFVMGFKGTVVRFWSEHCGPVVEVMRPEFEKWATEFLDKPQCGSLFAVFMEQPGAQGLVLDGLVWLEQAVAKRGDGYFREERFRRSILSCLDTCWSTMGLEVRKNKEAFSSMRTLLRMLADRQELLALELLRRIAEAC